jgi:hypothetical protein
VTDGFCLAIRGFGAHMTRQHGLSLANDGRDRSGRDKCEHGFPEFSKQDISSFRMKGFHGTVSRTS